MLPFLNRVTAGTGWPEMKDVMPLQLGCLDMASTVWMLACFHPTTFFPRASFTNHPSWLFFFLSFA